MFLGELQAAVREWSAWFRLGTSGAFRHAILTIGRDGQVDDEGGASGFASGILVANQDGAAMSFDDFLCYP